MCLILLEIVKIRVFQRNRTNRRHNRDVSLWAHPHWGRQTGLLNLLIQMFILFINNLTNTPRLWPSPQD